MREPTHSQQTRMSGAPVTFGSTVGFVSFVEMALGNRRSKSGILIRRAGAVACLHKCEAVGNYTAGTTKRCGQGSKSLPFVLVRIVFLDSGHGTGSVVASEDVELAVESDTRSIHNGGGHGRQSS